MQACDKFGIVCFENSFHGRSMGALSVTSNPKYQKPFAPLIPGIDVGKLNDLEGLQALVEDDTCAVIVEPVQGEGGVHVAAREPHHEHPRTLGSKRFGHGLLSQKDALEEKSRRRESHAPQ